MVDDVLYFILEDETVISGDTFVDITIITVDNALQHIGVIADLQTAFGVDYLGDEVKPVLVLEAEAVGKVGDYTKGEGLGSPGRSRCSAGRCC